MNIDLDNWREFVGFAQLGVRRVVTSMTENWPLTEDVQNHSTTG